MSLMNTVRNWFSKKNEVKIEPSIVQTQAYIEFLEADLRQAERVFTAERSELPLNKDNIRPIKFDADEFKYTPRPELFKLSDMQAISSAIDRINTRAKVEYPWKFIDTGVMAGGISLKPGKSEELLSWSEQNKALKRHEEETPLFMEAVKAHNKKINAERREKKRNVVHA